MSGVFQNIDPSPPGECAYLPAFGAGEDTLAGWRGGGAMGGQYFGRRQTLLMYSTYVSTLWADSITEQTQIRLLK
jgi:hypothetical protein